jgi:hypothetical protein
MYNISSVDHLRLLWVEDAKGKGILLSDVRLFVPRPGRAADDPGIMTETLAQGRDPDESKE